MSYQFVHMETYARAPNKRASKASARSIAREAERVPEAVPHVEAPQPPRLVHGVMPSEAVELAHERADQARDSLGRRLRKDAQVVAGIVASYPVASAELEPDDAELQDWIRRSLEWAQAEWGDQLQSAVLHLDEAHPHLHLYAVPELREDGTMSARDVHPGIAARDAIPAKKGNSTARKGAYKEAMRSLQDRYQEHVGQYHAQARLGPQRRRMTRQTWQAETVERQRMAQQLREAEATSEATAANAAALERRERQLDRQVAQLRKRLGRLRAREKAVQQDAEKLDGIGGRLGRVWAAVAGVSRRIEAQVRGEAEKRSQALSERIEAIEAERDQVRRERDQARQQTSQLKRRAQGAERRARQLQDTPEADRRAEAESRAATAERDARTAQATMSEVLEALEAGDADRARQRLSGVLRPAAAATPERSRSRDQDGPDYSR